MTGPNQPYNPQQPQPPYGQPPQPPYGQYPRPPKKRKVWPWVLLGVFLLMFGGCVAIIGTAGHEASKAIDAAASSIQSAADTPGASATSIPPLSAKPPTGKGKTVVYEIVSDSDGLNNVTYFDDNSAIQQESSPTAPWSKTVINNSTYAVIGLGAQTKGASVTCRIIVDGKVKDEKTATGKYAVVNCSGTI
ncbi:MmpS family transport accessory protein [Nocardia sp. CA-129566]|uniref:MmpS family transport accessory protein n=1 Tax=Nocardia sp. CA-129566 TaxID=3239976 RepID=UPI003D97D8D4